ncbi:MAG: hypothetical protein GY781_04275 [Gammaproteobacteria bacterium]|nr:hypothetical protein [Gammaproteobacteria bacterium]MCP5003914.1 hypothetical protein [Planctomycetota bacterium]
MVNSRNDNVKEAISIFKKRKVMTIEGLIDLLYCSAITVRRRLKQWEAITSYDNNGRYYTLPEIARFNIYGIWSYRNIHFSKYGNLKQTLIHLIRNSEEGLDALAIGELLGLQPRSFLSHFRERAELRREKITRRFIYFSSEAEVYEEQIKKRRERMTEQESISLSDAVCVSLLVEKIKHPDLDTEQLAGRLRRKGIQISVRAIGEFFDYHGIVKKTLDSHI